eukprot:TRINITY_DN29964_c0_g4_i1.p1 TRINITY_DN29964_c0_g4~~TRINITY_DN29964_c0_g4_i1.p1  ORF type:complete len:447 (+),score=70.32 TRINITY_DN29964_c0_g4_i1:190-1341(+)
MAGSSDSKQFRKSLKQWRGIAVGLGCQFVLLPALGCCCAKGFGLEPTFGIALLATTAAPGGAYSNFWCSVMNADLALSLAMTTVSTLASAVFLPMNLLLYVSTVYGEAPSLQWHHLFVNIALALTAIATGTGISFWYPKRHNCCNIVGNLSGITLIVFSVLASSRDDPIWDKSLGFYLAVGSPCLLGLSISFFFASCIKKLSWPQVVAVTVETCYQNTGLALSIILAILPEGEQGRGAGVPLFYGAMQVTVLPLFLVCSWRAGLTHAPPKTNVLQMVIGNFQPDSADSIAAVADDGATPVPLEVAPAEIIGDTLGKEQDNFDLEKASCDIGTDALEVDTACRMAKVRSRSKESQGSIESVRPKDIKSPVMNSDSLKPKVYWLH